MKVRALTSIRCQGPSGHTIQLVPGEIYALSDDIGESLVASGDAAEVQGYETQVQYPEETKDESSEETTATDAARDLAEEEDIDLDGVAGTGEDGKILKSDVQDALP